MCLPGWRTCGQAEELIREVREQYTHSNMLVYVPPGELDAADTEINNPFSVNKVICGSRVRGNGVMTASFQSETGARLRRCGLAGNGRWQDELADQFEPKRRACPEQETTSSSGLPAGSHWAKTVFEVQGLRYGWATSAPLAAASRLLSPGCGVGFARNKARSQVSSQQPFVRSGQAERDVSQAIQQELRGRLAADHPALQTRNVLLPLAPAGPPASRRADRRPGTTRSRFRPCWPRTTSSGAGPGAGGPSSPVIG